MSVPKYIRHRCAETHKSINEFVRCAFPSARHSGSGRYALITRCGLTVIELHKSEEEAAHAKAELDTTKCAGNCRSEHQVVRISPNPRHNQPTIRTITRDQ